MALQAGECHNSYRYTPLKGLVTPRRPDCMSCSKANYDLTGTNYFNNWITILKNRINLCSQGILGPTEDLRWMGFYEGDPREDPQYSSFFRLSTV